MAISEFIFMMAMINICIVCFVWTIKQSVLLGYWFYKCEMEKVENNE